MIPVVDPSCDPCPSSSNPGANTLYKFIAVAIQHVFEDSRPGVENITRHSSGLDSLTSLSSHTEKMQMILAFRWAVSLRAHTR
jgi:hypothetical protein